MSHTVAGALLGAVIALTWVALGFWQALFVGLAMLIGAGVARVLDGKLDLRGLLDVVRGRRSS